MKAEDIEKINEIYSKLKHLKKVKDEIERSTKLTFELTSECSITANKHICRFNIPFTKEEFIEIISLKITKNTNELVDLGITF